MDSGPPSDADGKSARPAEGVVDSDIAQSGMGAATLASQYDEEHIFRYLVFYLDTSSNADKNRLKAGENAANADARHNDAM